MLTARFNALPEGRLSHLCRLPNAIETMTCAKSARCHAKKPAQEPKRLPKTQKADCFGICRDNGPRQGQDYARFPRRRELLTHRLLPRVEAGGRWHALQHTAANRGISAQCPNHGHLSAIPPRGGALPSRSPLQVALLCSVTSSVLRPDPTFTHIQAGQRLAQSGTLCTWRSSLRSSLRRTEDWLGDGTGGPHRTRC
jgi:hypothetical protein